MALIECPDCGRQVSDSAALCIHCGRPMQNPGVPKPELQSTDSPAKFRCSECGGNAFKKYSLIWDEQRSSGIASSNTIGIGLAASGGLGVGGARTNTSS